ncbi:MAG: hypothetical protein AAF378_06600 [Cyanobacteria bacterium P01_A01_bin.84]
MNSKYRSGFTGLVLAGVVFSNFASFGNAANASSNLGQLDGYFNRATAEKTLSENTLTVAANNLPSPRLKFTGKEAYTVRGKRFYRYNLAVRNWNAYPEKLFKSAPELPPCGLNKNSSRTWVDIYNAQTNQRLYGFCALSSPKNLTSLWFAVEQGKTPPKAVYVVLKDRKTGKKYRSNQVVLSKTSVNFKEDCISFNPKNISVRRINGRWKIVEGQSHWMFDFGNKRNEAIRSLRTIKAYGMNKSCFVGRPNPSFQYLLTNNRAPSGAIKSEDCIRFNPNRATVKNINGRWTIVDRNHLMFNFGSKKVEAVKSLKVIKKYKFTRSCFVGRPGPSFKYLTR